MKCPIEQWGALDAFEFSENSESLRKFGVTAWGRGQRLDAGFKCRWVDVKTRGNPFDARMRKFAPFNRPLNKGALGFIKRAHHPILMAIGRNVV
jgi:hypothetical protein